MKVPILELKKQYVQLKNEIMESFNNICDEQYFIGGPYLEKCEQGLSKFSGSYAVGCSSGSDALLLCLMCIDIKPGDEVITTPFTFFATAGAIATLGAVPKFVDVDENNFNIDPSKIEAAITKKTKAIIAVDLYGQCADIKAIRKISDKHGITFIEDAAQSIGAEYNKKPVGQNAELTVISFYPGKNLGAFGDAGAVFTTRKDYEDKLKKLRVHGSSNRYFHDYVGINARLDALQAAVIVTKLKYLDEWTNKRIKAAKRYNELFVKAGLEDNLIIPHQEEYASKHVYNQYVVKVNERDKLQSFLQEKEISTNVFYPLGLHLQNCFKYLDYKKGDFPITEKLTEKVLALPIFPEITDDQIMFVVNSIVEFYRK